MEGDFTEKSRLKGLLGCDGRRFIAIRDGKIIYESDKRGILPLYSFMEKFREEAAGVWIGDTVVGRGGALLLVKACPGYVYAGLISEGACRVLESAGIAFEYDRRVPKILNREKTGPCPVETLAAEIEDPGEAWAAVGRFLEEINAKGEV